MLHNHFCILTGILATETSYSAVLVDVETLGEKAFHFHFVLPYIFPFIDQTETYIGASAASRDHVHKNNERNRSYTLKG